MSRASSIRIATATLRDVSFVLANLRPMDDIELRCQLPDGARMHEVAYGLLMAGDAFAALDDGQPIAVFGTNFMTPACRGVWALGTPRAKRAIPEVTRFMTGEYADALKAAGVLSLEARSHVGHEAAHRWMHSTGAVRVDPCFPYGKNGELFYVFRWTRDAFLRRT